MFALIWIYNEAENDLRSVVKWKVLAGEMCCLIKHLHMKLTVINSIIAQREHRLHDVGKLFRALGMDVMSGVGDGIGRVHIVSALLYLVCNIARERWFLAVDECDGDGVVQLDEFRLQGVLRPQIAVATDDGKCLLTAVK